MLLYGFILLLLIVFNIVIVVVVIVKNESIVELSFLNCASSNLLSITVHIFFDPRATMNVDRIEEEPSFCFKQTSARQDDAWRNAFAVRL